MAHKVIFLLLSFLLFNNTSYSQSVKINYYDIFIAPDIKNQSLSGSNSIYFSTEENKDSLKLNLSENLEVDSVIFHGKKMGFDHLGQKLLIKLAAATENEKLIIYYHGKPVQSHTPPWDGGLVWESDSLSRPWISVACEGIGASSWWPCLDRWDSEPDSMQITIQCPDSLMAVGNGNLVSKIKSDNKFLYTWKVHYPINNYCVNFTIGKFAHFSDTLKNLPLDYYILDYNLHKARKHFEQVPTILSAFEKLFGPYPFTNDGYALVETPYWGMEHQSAIAYGNQYKSNFFDLDYIIVHETAHEWWGNNITATDPGNMWIHEAFATYSESLLAEELYGKDAALEYLKKQKLRILNQAPVAGPLGVNYHDHPDTDQYFKGAWMLHSIRNTIDNDSIWFTCLRKLQQNFQFKTVSREELISEMERLLHKDLENIFHQYLDFNTPPVLTWKQKIKGTKGYVYVKWDADAKDFSMPFSYILNGKLVKMTCNSSKYTIIELKRGDSFAIDQSLFYYLISKQ